MMKVLTASAYMHLLKVTLYQQNSLRLYSTHSLTPVILKPDLSRPHSNQKGQQNYIPKMENL